jgi:NAD-dependent dihydropyrimidine dehydrogenase PreA subunit
MPLFVESEKCDGCRLCVSVCPVQAISLVENKALIDQNRCSECLLCLDECPTKAISQVSEKEPYVRQKEYPISSSLNRTVPQARQTFSNRRTQPHPTRTGGVFVNGVKRAVDGLFKVGASFGVSRNGRRMNQRRQRRRHRGGGFRRMA